MAFRRPPPDATCSSCQAVVALPFTYRLIWCFQLTIAALWLPSALWMLWGDLNKLGRGDTWIVAVLGGLWWAGLVGLFVALPLTFVLRPKARSH